MNCEALYLLIITIISNNNYAFYLFLIPQSTVARIIAWKIEQLSTEMQISLLRYSSFFSVELAHLPQDPRDPLTPGPQRPQRPQGPQRPQRPQWPQGRMRNEELRCRRIRGCDTGKTFESLRIIVAIEEGHV